MKKLVLIRGPILSQSGYGVHVRQVFQWLETVPDVEIVSQILPWGITPWNVNSDDENGLIGRILETSKPVTRKPDLSIQIQLPNEWDNTLATKNIGITAGVETDKCNPDWVNIHCSKMDLVIVPSLFAKTTFLASGKTSTPIEVVPESYFDELLVPNTIRLDLESEFNFLIVGSLTGDRPENDRKNIYYAIKWFCEEFAGNKDVGLILKISRGRDTTIDRDICKKILRQLLAEVRKGEFPKITLLHGAVDKNEMAGLYMHPKVKALISATRGEGFGLPLLEAAVTGLPVIATGWSAHNEFLGRFSKIQYALKEIPENRVDNQIFMKGSKWAEVDEASFKHKLRLFLKSSEAPLEWAKETASRLKETHSHTSISNAYDKVIQKHSMLEF